jgi:3-oxoadipate enol-lactonase
MPSVELPGVRLYYERAGSGPRLLVVNGSGTDLRNEPNPFSFPIADHFDLLAYDHRGLGRSEPAQPEGQPAMADFAGDAIALLDHVGWDDCAVIGISFGGMVAQELALRASGRVTRLVLACTSAGGGGGASYPLHETWAAPPDERIERLVMLMDTRAAHDPTFADLLRQWMASGERGEVEAPAGLVRQLEARRHHDTWDRLADLKVPTMVAAGRFDGIAPPANSEAMVSRIPGAQLAVFDGGHGFFAQDPAAWPAMIDFLLGG